jgi:hypothetical protein
MERLRHSPPPPISNIPSPAFTREGCLSSAERCGLCWAFRARKMLRQWMGRDLRPFVARWRARVGRDKGSEPRRARTAPLSPLGFEPASLQRLAALAPSAHVEVYELSDATWGMERREAARSRTISSTAGPSCARCLRAELGNEAGQRPLKKEGKQPAEQDRFPGCVQKRLDYLDEKAAQRLQIGAINRRGTYATSRPCGRSGASTAARYAT